jgi:hypothetical protein
LFTTALEICNEEQLIFDFAIGANQGQGVPVAPQTPGLAKQLVYGEVRVNGGEKFDAAIPGPDLEYNRPTFYTTPHEHWGPSSLIGVVVGAVKSSK